MTHFYELSTTTKQQCEAQAVQHFYATWQHSAIGAFRMPTAAPLARDLSRMDFATTIGRAHSRCGLLAHGWSRLSHPSVLQAASSSKAAVSALAPYPLVNAPSHSESLWLITDLSRTNTPTLFTTPRKNVMSYT